MATILSSDARYINHGQYGVTREQWLDAVARDQFKPKPPEWWLADQGRQGRNRTTASIIWTRNYKADRKFVIWDQAPLEDFIYLGYYW